MNSRKTLFAYPGMQIRKKIDAGWERYEALHWEYEALQKREGNDKAGKLRSLHFCKVGLLWAESAFSQVTTTHKLAASMMMTSIPAEYHSEILPPWDCFCVDVPSGLIPGADFFFCCRMVDQNDCWLLLVIGDGGYTSLHADSFQELFAGADHTTVLEGADQNGSVIGDSYVEQIDKRQQLLFRLLAGLCIELMDPKYGVAKNRGKIQAREKRGEPRPYTYHVVRNVKVDVRGAVADYLSNNTDRIMSVQCLVRGHSKRQAHGPGNSLRKWIHIEPYWRGPEDAPIAVRSHVL